MTGADHGAREWLLRLEGDREHDPVSGSNHRAAGEALLGPGPIAWAVQVGWEMAQSIGERVPAYGTLPSLDVLRTGTESTTVELLLHLWIGDGSTPVGTAEAMLGDQEFVRRGIPLDAVLRGIRVAHALLMRRLFQEIATHLDDPVRMAEMERASSIVFEYMDAFAQRVTEEYTAEQERWLSSGVATRAELARALLDAGREVDVDAAALTLRYPLNATHVAAVVWRDLSTPGDDELIRVASRLAANPDTAGVLVVPDGSHVAWVWAAFYGAIPAERVFTAPTGGGVHVAIGSPGAGLGGFRRSHLEAAATADVVRATTPMSKRGTPSVSEYETLGLAVLAGQNLTLARSLVQRELGPLADDTPAAAELRETTSAYLATHRSLGQAAARLHVARGTVAYRIRKVEGLLDRSLQDRRLELEVALRLAGQLGRAVLRQE